jgi:hypothetical protein
MPSVAKEIDVPVARLEQIQRQHRSLLSAVEMMSTGMERCEREVIRLAFAGGAAGVREALLAAARALRFGGGRHPEAAAQALRLAPADGQAGGAETQPAPAELTPELQGPYWLGQRVEEQVAELRALLLETEPRWNIERATHHRMV